MSTEDAKRLAIKEEQYDPGYEDAYGGAYVERGPEGSQAENQSNGHCTFSSAENTGKSFRYVSLRASSDSPNIHLQSSALMVSSFR